MMNYQQRLGNMMNKGNQINKIKSNKKDKYNNIIK